MWCPSCRADVATELSSDFRRFSCPHCGGELGVAAAALQQKPSRIADPATGAAAVLARWAAEEKLPYEAAVSGVAQPARLPAAPLPLSEIPNTTSGATTVMTAQSATGGSVTGQRATGSSQAWLASAGQLLAYGGVLVLTCGTVMIISRQLGPAAGNALSGWLVAAVGQMLLLLGVVTLVSYSLEQTRLEVLQRLELLERRSAETVESAGVPSSPNSSGEAASPSRRRVA